ncbi:MAG: histidine phosphatase family protein [Proteobacteria bacterium]|nr:histidine phosphatase family protein [Burkholderiales bacterium]
MNVITQCVFVLYTAFVFATALANAQTVDVKLLAAALREGDHVIVLRHGATNRDQADTDPLNYDNVARQRLLSEAGRLEARRVGDALKTLGISFGTVFTSRYHRAVESGQLIGGGEVTQILDVTEGGLVATPIENDRRTEALRKMATARPPAGKNTLIVTHKPNIVDAFGRDWFDIREGEASIFRPDGSGKHNFVGRVQASDWIGAAK